MNHDRIIQSMRQNNVKNYQADKLMNCMDELIDNERRKLYRWQRVKKNQESNFKRELNKFHTEIETRKSRLSRVLGKQLLNSRTSKFKFDALNATRSTSMTRYKNDEMQK